MDLKQRPMKSGNEPFLMNHGMPLTWSQQAGFYLGRRVGVWGSGVWGLWFKV